ncbi:MAG: ferric reductase-like transmembrane domain-containing protein [Propionibacteriaceae bacterium]
MNQLLWFGTRATALTSIVLLTLTVVLGALTAGRGAPLGLPPFVRTSLHRRLALVMVCFVALHVITAISETYVDIGWASLLVPFTAGYRPFWVGLGTFAFDLLAAIMISSLLRERMPQRSWRVVHWLTYALWPIALLHGFGTSSSDGTLVTAITIGCAGAGLAAVGWRASTGRSVARRQLADAQSWS